MFPSISIGPSSLNYLQQDIEKAKIQPEGREVQAVVSPPRSLLPLSCRYSILSRSFNICRSIVPVSIARFALFRCAMPVIVRLHTKKKVT